jgi:aspartyl-tRNA(Asn)/glutamyl-tRNA(Gln) amidotransferase subunit C
MSTGQKTENAGGASAGGLTKDVVEKVSKLARLQLTEAELTEFTLQLSAVLENFEQISQVDTKGVQPLLTPTDMSMHLREDVAVEQGSSERFLDNAPEKQGRLFKVPPVV